MELQQFVGDAFVQVSTGAQQANDALAETNARVNPPNVYPTESKYAHLYGHIQTDQTVNRAVHLVEFDVAVQATEDKETKGGLGIVVATVALGTQGKSETAQASQSRITFGVPLMFRESKV